MSGCSRTRSSSRTAGRSTELIALLTLVVGFTLIAEASTPVPIRGEADRNARILRKWTLPGSPGGLAVGRDGKLFVGLSDRQSIVRIDPSRDLIEKEVILDRPEIASTKDLVTLRIDEAGPVRRLLTANGTDESATILSLDELAIRREITLEGELVRDIHPDPAARFLFVLGRDLHVFDWGGDNPIRTISEPRPMAIAVSSDGSHFAVAGSERIAGTTVTTLGLWTSEPLREIRRIPLQTDAEIVSLSFAAGDRSIVAASTEAILQLTLSERTDQDESALVNTDRGVRMRVRAADLISSDKVCLPDRATPQVMTLGPSGSEILFPEKRCGVGASFTAGRRLVSIDSLYGLEAHSIVFDPSRRAVFASGAGNQVVLYRYEPEDSRR